MKQMIKVIVLAAGLAMLILTTGCATTSSNDVSVLGLLQLDEPTSRADDSMAGHIERGENAYYGGAN